MSERNTIHDIKKRHEQDIANMCAVAKVGKIVLPPWTAHVDRGTLLTKVKELEAAIAIHCREAGLSFKTDREAVDWFCDENVDVDIRTVKGG